MRRKGREEVGGKLEKIDKQILRCLARGEALTVSEIAKGINEKREIVSTHITKLIEKGLIEEEISYEDSEVIGSGVHRRSYMGMEPAVVIRYVLTKKGEKILN